MFLQLKPGHAHRMDLSKDRELNITVLVDQVTQTGPCEIPGT